MNIIIDASTIIAVITDESEKELIVSLTKDVDIIAPLSVHWEIGNAFSAMLKRRRISLEQALQAIRVYKSIPIRFVDIDLESAIKIAQQFNIYVYDAYLIEASIRYKMPLLTLDIALACCAKNIGIKIIEVKP